MKRKIIRIGYILRLTLFTIVFLTFIVIGFCAFLRPKSSELEKRKLMEFPRYSNVALWDGKFLTDVSKWYSDTYPFRESLISLKSETEEYYGIRDTAIYGDTAMAADAIPQDENEEAPIISYIPDISETDSVKNEDNSVSGKSSDKSETKEVAVITKNKKKKNGTLKVKPEVAGTIYVAKNRGFTLYYFNKKGADIYASMLNTVAKKLNSDKIYDIIVPNSFGVNLDEKIQSSMRTSNQGDAISYIYKRLSKSIKTVETYKKLREHNSEYLYFKTDHHWTARGAYYVYENFCKRKGIEPHKLSYFKKKIFKNFLGSFYSFSNQSKALECNLDEVEVFIPRGTNIEKITPVTGRPYTHNIISDADKFSRPNKYLAFIGGDRPLIEIKNPKINDGSACIIVKESYGNAFVPFLVDHYQYVYVLDYRYYKGNATALFKKHANTDLIFLNNTAATGVEKSKLMLGMFR